MKKKKTTKRKKETGIADTETTQAQDAEDNEGQDDTPAAVKGKKGLRAVYGPTPGDWDELATFFKDTRNIVFSYRIPAMQKPLVVSMNADFLICSKIPHGGNPSGRIYIGLHRHGFAHFSYTLAAAADPTSLRKIYDLNTVQARVLAELFAELSPRIENGGVK